MELQALPAMDSRPQQRIEPFSGPPPASVEVLIEDVTLQRFRTAEEFHSRLDLPFSSFAARMLELSTKYNCGAGRDAIATFIQGLHTNDLYLALACAQGEARAWVRFTNLYSCFIYSQALYISRRKEDAAEMAAAAIANIVTPGAGGRHRLRSFEGRGSLATWLRVLVRNVVETARRTRGYAALPFELDMVDEKGVARLERSLLSERYYATASAALHEACNALPERSCRVLLLRYEEALALADIARLLRIHESTVIRHIQEAQAILRLSTRRALARSGLSAQAISECIDDLLYNPRYSLLATLKTVNGKRTPGAGCAPRAKRLGDSEKETF